MNFFFVVVSFDHSSCKMSFQWLKKISKSVNEKHKFQKFQLPFWPICMADKSPCKRIHLEVQLCRMKHQILATAANLNQQKTHCAAPHHSFPAPTFTASPASHLSCSHTKQLQPLAVHEWEDALCIFSKAGIFQSSKGITSQGGKATGVSPFMGNRASVAFIKQTKRGTQGLKGIIDYRWIMTNYHPRNCLFFAIKESEAQVRGQDSRQWSTNCEEVWFYPDEKGVVRLAANFTTLHFWLKKNLKHWDLIEWAICLFPWNYDTLQSSEWRWTKTKGKLVPGLKPDANRDGWDEI